MREILYRKKQSLKTRRKIISLSERAEDTECRTHVRKSFVYIVTKVTEVKETLAQPEVFVKKAFNTKTKEENFSFRVKGSFYMNRDRVLFKIDFCHSLRIRIVWKTKNLSPKKSVTLT